MAKDKPPRSKADLLGPAVAKEDRKPKIYAEDAEIEWSKLRSGVTQNWLCGFTKMHPNTVRRKLGNCPTVENGRGKGREKYDPVLALTMLLKPRATEEEMRRYISDMGANELPVMLRKEFWDAENKRLNYEERAGELWHTEDVLAQFAEAFKQIKNQVQVWVDDIERETAMAPEQYKILTARVDALRTSLYDVLIEMPKNAQTQSVLGTRDHSAQESAEES